MQVFSNSPLQGGELSQSKTFQLLETLRLENNHLTKL